MDQIGLAVDASTGVSAGAEGDSEKGFPSGLERLPLTRINLYRSFSASIDTSGIIQLCQGPRLSIKAEGIERPEQLDVLVGSPAAIFAQSYLIARPQTPDDLLPVLARLPDLTGSLLHASVARLPDAQIAENRPFITSTYNELHLASGAIGRRGAAGGAS